MQQSYNISKRLQNSMIKAFTHEQGQDIFIRNSYGYLIHRWTRRSRNNLEDYKVIAEDVSSDPVIFYLYPNYHILYISRDMKLKHQQINALNTLETSECQIASDIDKNRNLLSFLIFNKTVYLEASRNEKAVYFTSKIRQISLPVNEMFKQQKRSSITSNILDVWQQVQECTLFRDIRKALETYNQGQATKQVISFPEVKFQNQQQSFLYVQIQHQIYKVELTQEQEVQHLQPNISLFYQNKLENRILEVTRQDIQKRVLVLLARTDKELVIAYQKKPNQWAQLAVQLQKPFRSSASIICSDQTYFLICLDANEQLVRCPQILSQKNKAQLGKSLSRPYLIWQEIRDKCTSLGEQGYHADCFHYKQQNLVIKKFRKPSKAFKSNREVHYLKKIQQIQPNLYHHDIISHGIITGFSMNFYKGQNWYQLTSDPQHLLNKSPIARVQLVVKLGEFMRKLQSISFCHGDLHLENILIDIQQQDIVNPKMTIKVIDFGNGFEMFEGETVSEGLTGFSPIVPPEAQFSYKKNYNPWGLNAYQFGRNSLHILLQNMQRNLCKLDYTPLRQLQLLKQNKQYPQELYQTMKQLVHYQIEKRNNALFKDISHLESQTRKIYIQNQKHS